MIKQTWGFTEIAILKFLSKRNQPVKPQQSLVKPCHLLLDLFQFILIPIWKSQSYKFCPQNVQQLQFHGVIEKENIWVSHKRLKFEMIYCCRTRLRWARHSCYKSKKGNSQELTQFSPRSYPRHLVGKKTAQQTLSNTLPAIARWTALSHTGGHRPA